MGPRFSITFTKRKIAVTGIGALFFIVALFVAINYFADTLDPERAQKWIRLHLKKEITNEFMESLNAAGRKVPDEQTAQQLKDDLARIDRLEFVDVEINDFLIPPPFTTRRIFVVKAVIRDEKNNEKTRYFSLSADNNIFDFFWVNEHSRLIWFFST